MSYKKLDCWNLAIELVENIYNITSAFPVKEKFNLVSQINRSAVSIPSNIAEGSARQSDKEMIQFLYVALGSIAELETQLIISQKLGYTVQKDIYDKIINVRKLIIGLVKYLKSKKGK